MGMTEEESGDEREGKDGLDSSDPYSTEIIEWNKGNNLRRNYRVYFFGNDGLDQGKFSLGFFFSFGVKR